MVRGPCSMAALISRFVNVPIAGAHRAWHPTQSPPRPHPSRPACGRLEDSILEERGKARPLFRFFSLKHLSFVGGKSLAHPSASCIPLSYSLAIVQFVTVCFTPDHLLSTHPRRLSPSLLLQCLSLVGCLPLSGKQLFLSAQPTLCLFTGSSSCSLTPPRLLLFILLPRCPIIFPFNSGTLCALSTLFAASTRMIMSHPSPPFFSLSPTSCLRLQTEPSVFCKHRQPVNHLSATLHLLLVLTATDSTIKMLL